MQDLKDTLIYTRISGYGQTGPKAQLAGYASVCEAYGGIRCGTLHCIAPLCCCCTPDFSSLVYLYMHELAILLVTCIVTCP